MGPTAKVRILRFKNLSPFRHYRGMTVRSSQLSAAELQPEICAQLCPTRGNLMFASKAQRAQCRHTMPVQIPSQLLD